MSDLVSVIIPIYKVEAYLERCVQSVLEQTYPNLEIILVDDGSPDRCGEICENLALKDTRVKVYHKKNGGLSDARNHGVERSNGKYITFIDSDDYIAMDYIEYLVSMMKKHDADISCCCMVQTNGDTAEYCSNDNIPEEQIFTGKEACDELLGNLYMVLVTACGRLFRSEIVKKYPFPVGKKHEDEATTCKYYYESEKVVVGNRRLYAYYQNMQSITHTKGGAFNEDLAWALAHRAEFFEERNEIKLAKKAWTMLFYYFVQDSQKNAGRCDAMIKEFGKRKHLSFRVWVEMKIYNISPRLYEGYRRACALLGRVKTRAGV